MVNAPEQRDWFKEFVIMCVTGASLMGITWYVLEDNRRNERILHRAEPGLCQGRTLATKGVQYTNCRTINKLVAPRSAKRQDLTSTEANRFLDALVTSDLQGSYDAYLTPGAEKAIIHIRRPSAGYENQEPLTKHANESIYSILHDLSTKGIRQVYCEGSTQEMAESVDTQSWMIKENAEGRKAIVRSLDVLIPKYQRSLVQAIASSPLNDYRTFRSESLQLHEWLVQGLERKRDYLAEAQTLYRSDPVFRIAADGRMRIAGAESLDSWLVAQVTRDSALGEQPLRHKRNAYVNYFDDREDMLLWKMAQSPETVIVVYWDERSAFGGYRTGGKEYAGDGRYGIRDNIARWNDSGRGVRFSLAEITPLTNGQRRKSIHK